jgi:hypothetical protein
MRREDLLPDHSDCKKKKKEREPYVEGVIAVERTEDDSLTEEESRESKFLTSITRMTHTRLTTRKKKNKKNTLFVKDSFRLFLKGREIEFRENAFY